MVIFNSYVSLPEGTMDNIDNDHYPVWFDNQW